MSFYSELKRRKVFRLALVYLIVAWVLVQIVATVEAPRASAQLFYQFDPLFHDNMIFSYHPRSDIIR